MGDLEILKQTQKQLLLLNKYRKRKKGIVRASGDGYQNIADPEIQQASKLQALEGDKLR